MKFKQFIFSSLKWFRARKFIPLFLWITGYQSTYFENVFHSIEGKVDILTNIKSSELKTPSKVNHSTAIKNYTVSNIDRFILML